MGSKHRVANALKCNCGNLQKREKAEEEEDVDVDEVEENIEAANGEERRRCLTYMCDSKSPLWWGLSYNPDRCDS